MFFVKCLVLIALSAHLKYNEGYSLRKDLTILEDVFFGDSVELLEDIPMKRVKRDDGSTTSSVDENSDKAVEPVTDSKTINADATEEASTTEEADASEKASTTQDVDATEEADENSTNLSELNSTEIPTTEAVPITENSVNSDDVSSTIKETTSATDSSSNSTADASTVSSISKKDETITKQDSTETKNSKANDTITAKNEAQPTQPINKPGAVPKGPYQRGSASDVHVSKYLSILLAVSVAKLLT